MRSDEKIESFRGDTYFVYSTPRVEKVVFNHKQLSLTSTY